MVIGEILKSW